MGIIEDRIRKLVLDDFLSIKEYYNNFTINRSLIEGNNSELLKTMHKFTYVLNLFISKINVTDYSEPYMIQLKSDSIMLINCCAFGDVLGLKLHERLLIENFFRYLYYYHHEIEHKLLQIEPSKFIPFHELFKYVKKYPEFECDSALIIRSVDFLKDKHSDLSRYVHTSTIEHMSLVDNILSINRPIPNIDREIRIFRGISQHVFFIFLNFHLDYYNRLALDEKLMVTDYLTSEQKRGLAGII